MLLVPAVMRPVLVVRPAPVDPLALVADFHVLAAAAPVARVDHPGRVGAGHRGRVAVDHRVRGAGHRALVGDHPVREAVRDPEGGGLEGGVVPEVVRVDPRVGLSVMRRGRNQRKKRTPRNRPSSLKAR